MYQMSQSVRNNEQLKAPNAVEYITEEERDRRYRELIRCKNDPIYFAERYFYIVAPQLGKHIIRLFEKQKDLIREMVKEDRIVCLASRQTGKTTAYNIFALWYTIFNRDKHILICANTAESSSDFVARITMAYELLPMWLKPGIDPNNWNKRRIKFANGCSVSSSPTSPAVRGKSCDVLILDEFSFVDPSIETEFWYGVYPVISSARGTKVIIVSTPNGTGNKFYELYSQAELGIDSGDGSWKHFRIDWFDRPGRDEAWKQTQINSLGGDMRAWGQEFGNCLGIDTEVIIQYPNGKTKLVTLKKLKEILEQ